MPTRLGYWGNSLALRISSYIVDCAHLQHGDLMDVRLLDSGDVLVRPVEPRNGGGSIEPQVSQPGVTQAKKEKEVW